MAAVRGASPRWCCVGIIFALLHYIPAAAQQEMLFVVDRESHRIMSWEVGGKEGSAVAGCAVAGCTYGESMLSNPGGVDIAHGGKTIFVSDTDNHRIVRWREGDTQGTVVAGGNGKGSNANQLNFPYGIVSGFDGASIYVVDSENARVVVWYIGGKSAALSVAGGNGKGAKDNQLDNPRGVAVGGTSVLVADSANHRVMLWKSEQLQGVVVAGGNGQGPGLHQLDSPQDVEVIMDGLNHKVVYVADSGNNRVVKWVSGAKKGEVVAGGNGKGARMNQLSYPAGIAVADGGDTLYVSDRTNNRVVRWVKGSSYGVVVAGGNGVGRAANQLTMPYDIVTWKGTTTSTTTRTGTTTTTITTTTITTTTYTQTTSDPNLMCHENRCKLAAGPCINGDGVCRSYTKDEATYPSCPDNFFPCKPGSSSSTASTVTTATTVTITTTISSTTTSVTSTTVSSTTTSQSATTVSSTTTTTSTSTSTSTTATSTTTSSTTTATGTTTTVLLGTYTGADSCLACIAGTSGPCVFAGTTLCARYENVSTEFCGIGKERCADSFTTTSSTTTTVTKGGSIQCSGCAEGTSGPCIFPGVGLCSNYEDEATQSCSAGFVTCTTTTTSTSSTTTATGTSTTISSTTTSVTSTTVSSTTTTSQSSTAVSSTTTSVSSTTATGTSTTTTASDTNTTIPTLVPIPDNVARSAGSGSAIGGAAGGGLFLIAVIAVSICAVRKKRAPKTGLGAANYNRAPPTSNTPMLYGDALYSAFAAADTQPRVVLRTASVDSQPASRQQQQTASSEAIYSFAAASGHSDDFDASVSALYHTSSPSLLYDVASPADHANAVDEDGAEAASSEAIYSFAAASGHSDNFDASEQQQQQPRSGAATDDEAGYRMPAGQVLSTVNNGIAVPTRLPRNAHAQTKKSRPVSTLNLNLRNLKQGSHSTGVVSPLHPLPTPRTFGVEETVLGSLSRRQATYFFASEDAGNDAPVRRQTSNV